jgi:hypothetical protein
MPDAPLPRRAGEYRFLDKVPKIARRHGAWDLMAPRRWQRFDSKCGSLVSERSNLALW